jgi:hypothetical protein
MTILEEKHYPNSYKTVRAIANFFGRLREMQW